jgi:hypothetical protein
MLPGNDVLNVKCHFPKFFQQSAILAAIVRALSNETA